MLLSPSTWPDYDMTTPLLQDLLPQSLGGTGSPPTFINPISPVASQADNIPCAGPRLCQDRETAATTATHLSLEKSSASTNNEYLLNSFLQIFFPPILAPVEIGPKLSATRAFFASMCSESSMVRLAAMAFSAFQLSASRIEAQFDYKPLYESAFQEIHAELQAGASNLLKQKDLKHFLTAIFLLTYADVSRIPTTCSL